MVEVKLNSEAKKEGVALATEPQPKPKMRFTLDYLKCPMGRVKIAQVALNVLVSVYVNLLRGPFFWSLWHFGLVFGICGTMSGLHLAAVVSNLTQIHKETPWRKIEFVYCWFAVVLLLFSSNLGVNLSGPQRAHDFIFSVIAIGDLLLYLYNIILLYGAERPSPAVPVHSGLVDFP